MDLNERIPNNVNLSEDKRLQRALERWLPNFLSWWHDMGTGGFQEKDVWLRPAIDVWSEGEAQYHYMKMSDWSLGMSAREESRSAKCVWRCYYRRRSYEQR